MGQRTKIGLIQVKLNPEDGLETKWENLLDLGRKCLQAGAQLVFFPEAYQYTHDRTILSRPAEVRGAAAEWKARCAALAREYHAYVAPWDYEIDECGDRYNTSYILDRGGTEVGRFRKVHLTYTEQEWGLRNGADFPVFDLDVGKVGFMICFDNYWPESARILGLRGAELVLYPLYGDTLIPQWELKLRVRAIDNSMYIASSQIGDARDVAFSALVNPKGEVVCRLDDAPAWSVVEADLGRPVVTSTGGRAECREDLRRYLQRCRNLKAYGPLVEPVKDAWSWEDVFLGKRPQER